MRITGGRFCGRRVVIPRGELEIRPAMDRMRESLFSVLGPLDGLSFCDLFSGSGCVGLEAASRGAVLVDLVEMDRSKKATIEKNTEFAKPYCDIRLFCSDVLKFIPECNRKYDVVYADPPFPMPDKTRLALLVSENKTVNEGGRFVIHIPSSEADLWEERIGNLTLKDTRIYGRNMVKIYVGSQLQSQLQN
ncbi:MAG: RsmD family RNA methyltransferase [Sphaerochaetaceae bacterium]|nr:RsmD family RNA methyltransferase [Sphaerochaetaceae bacterium]